MQIKLNFPLYFFELALYQDHQAWFKLGSPASQHFVPHHIPPPTEPKRRKGPGRRQKDCDRAAAHRAKHSSAVHSSTTSAASAETVEVPTSQTTPTAAGGCSSPARAASALPPSTTPSPTNAASAVPTTTQLAVSASLSTPAVASASGSLAAVSLEDELCSDTQHNKALGELTVVNAVAEFENSPFQQLGQEDLTSLKKFLNSEDHLRKNIVKTEFEVVFNWKVSVKLHVRNANLWENPCSCSWKFLGGENFWERGNGTKIRLQRIHVK